jgi:hypothetical protein
MSELASGGHGGQSLQQPPQCSNNSNSEVEPNSGEAIPEADVASPGSDQDGSTTGNGNNSSTGTGGNNNNNTSTGTGTGSSKKNKKEEEKPSMYPPDWWWAERQVSFLKNL